MKWEIHASDGRARAGKLKLKHGNLLTPTFMPVGTVGSVKSLIPRDLEEIDAQIILGNTYHLYLRPGMEIIKNFGGLHSFINWQKPILTDSGGFQIFSLARQRQLDESGATFRSHIDGKKIHLTPELAIEIQETLGSDIHMILDECTPHPVTQNVASLSMERSLRWAMRCKNARTRSDVLQFGIVQGSLYPDLRKRSIDTLQEIGFDGYAIGGLSVGEPKEDLYGMTDLCCQHMPSDAPRYLMGVGTPLDIIEAVNYGVDMFDCVMPTRNGRNGMAFTSHGKVIIKNARHRLDDSPLDANCSCYTCKTFSRSYLRHLYVSKELTVLRLLSLHNLHYYLNLTREIRAAITAGTYSTLVNHHRELWNS